MSTNKKKVNKEDVLHSKREMVSSNPVMLCIPIAVFKSMIDYDPIATNIAGWQFWIEESVVEADKYMFKIKKVNNSGSPYNYYLPTPSELGILTQVYHLTAPQVFISATSSSYNSGNFPMEMFTSADGFEYFYIDKLLLEDVLSVPGEPYIYLSKIEIDFGVSILNPNQGLFSAMKIEISPNDSTTIEFGGGLTIRPLFLIAPPCPPEWYKRGSSIGV